MRSTPSEGLPVPHGASGKPIGRLRVVGPVRVPTRSMPTVAVVVLTAAVGCGVDLLDHGQREGNLTAETLALCESLPDDLELIEADGEGLQQDLTLATGWLEDRDAPVLRLASDADLQCGEMWHGTEVCVRGWGIGLHLRAEALAEESTLSLPVAATEVEFAQTEPLSDGGCGGRTGVVAPEAGAIEFFAINEDCVTGRLVNAGPARLTGGFYALRCIP